MRGVLLGVAGALLMGVGGAQAGVLSWSYARAQVGYTPYTGPNTPLPRVVVDADTAFGPNRNAAAFAHDFANGQVAGAWADSGDLGLVPELHAGVLVAPTVPGFVFSGGALTQGVQAVTWTGGAFDFDPALLQGTLDYAASSAGGSYINAGFAIIDGNAFATNPGLGLQYFQSGVDPNTGLGNAFAADCDTPGAIGFANTGPSHAEGPSVTLTASMASCGPVHLETGDTLVFWSKLGVYHSGGFIGEGGYIDATHTFSIDFAPGADEATQALLVSNLAPVSFNPGAAVPEPASWAIMVMGLGAVGGAMRRRRKVGIGARILAG